MNTNDNAQLIARGRAKKHREYYAAAAPNFVRTDGDI
jgi:hypothetical protein